MDETPNDVRAHLNDARIAGELEANGSVADERAAALSAAMASLFGDAPESWLLEAEDVLEHLRMCGYCIVPTDRLVSVALKYQALDIGMIGLVPGDLEQSGAGE